MCAKSITVPITDWMCFYDNIGCCKDLITSLSLIFSKLSSESGQNANLGQYYITFHSIMLNPEHCEILWYIFFTIPPPPYNDDKCTNVYIIYCEKPKNIWYDYLYSIYIGWST